MHPITKDPERFSEVVRQMSPSRFRHFVEGVIDFERRNRRTEDWNVVPDLRVRREELTTQDCRFSCFAYKRIITPEPGWSTTKVSCFLAAHHVPSLVAGTEHATLFSRDMERLTQLSLYQELLDIQKEYRISEFYYVTNKDFWRQWQGDAQGCREEYGRLQSSAGVSLSFDCIDPYSIANALDRYPEVEGILLETLTRQDGLIVEFSPSDLCVRPFIAADVFPVCKTNDSYVLNVDATLLAEPRLSTLLGLKDILTLRPDERRIEAFLTASPSLFHDMGYMDFRTQVTIAETGERPDFFLERSDGLWDVLELKRPKPFRALVKQSGNMLEIARYLRMALKQCETYLRLLDSRTTKRRLAEHFGIRIDEPRVILLIGQEPYPPALLNTVRTEFHSRIRLQSFSELLKACKETAKRILEQMTAISRATNQGIDPDQ